MNIILVLFIILFILIVYWVAPNLSIFVWIIIVLLMLFIIYEYYTNTHIPANSNCIKTGCTGQICADEPKISTCEWKCEDSCYKKAQCTNLNGQCQWNVNNDIQNCLNECKKQ